MDVLNIKVFSINIPDEEPKQLDMKITFFDQLLVSSVVISTNARESTKGRAIVRGQMSYDPSDYEKMGLFADNPLIGTHYLTVIQSAHYCGTLYRKNNRRLD